MKAVINEIEYDDVRWWIDSGVGMLEIISEKSIAEIVEDIGENNEIEMFNDEGEQTSVWKNNGLDRIYSLLDDGVRHVVIGLVASIISDNAETIINENIDESVDGIIELAGMIADTADTVAEHDEAIEQLQAKKDEFENRIVALENAVSGIPDDITSRFSELWTNYNSLADRVARLENKG